MHVSRKLHDRMGAESRELLQRLIRLEWPHQTSDVTVTQNSRRGSLPVFIDSGINAILKNVDDKGSRCVLPWDD